MPVTTRHLTFTIPGTARAPASRLTTQQRHRVLQDSMSPPTCSKLLGQLTPVPSSESLTYHFKVSPKDFKILSIQTRTF